MPSLKSFRVRIASVKSTRKITKAMQMVAAAKLRRAQAAAEAARPYAQRMERVLSNLGASMKDNPGAPKLLAGTGRDDVHLVIVATGDRGLAGGFNSNIVKLARQHIGKLLAAGKQVKILAVGRKGRDQLRRDYARLIVDTIELTTAALTRIRGRAPKLLVCGLNPHAGEHGLFGDSEEEKFIEPAVAIARQRGIQIDGPLPPDTVFLPERRRTTDGFICMYHDQGHIPLKALAFDLAVNITLGLPIIRTSVDHGTACDIAWQGKADVSSMVQAVKLAARLARE